jgi:hypothetical protein
LFDLDQDTMRNRTRAHLSHACRIASGRARPLGGSIPKPPEKRTIVRCHPEIPRKMT